MHDQQPTDRVKRHAARGKTAHWRQRRLTARDDQSQTHNGPKAQLGDAACELLPMRVIKVAIEDLLGEREGSVQPEPTETRSEHDETR